MEILSARPQPLTIEARHTISLEVSKQRRLRVAKSLFLPRKLRQKNVFICNEIEKARSTMSNRNYPTDGYTTKPTSLPSNIIHPMQPELVTGTKNSGLRIISCLPVTTLSYPPTSNNRTPHSNLNENVQTINNSKQSHESIELERGNETYNLPSSNAINELPLPSSHTELPPLSPHNQMPPSQNASNELSMEPIETRPYQSMQSPPRFNTPAEIIEISSDEEDIKVFNTQRRNIPRRSIPEQNRTGLTIPVHTMCTGGNTHTQHPLSAFILPIEPNTCHGTTCKSNPGYYQAPPTNSQGGFYEKSYSKPKRPIAIGYNCVSPENRHHQHTFALERQPLQALGHYHANSDNGQHAESYLLRLNTLRNLHDLALKSYETTLNNLIGLPAIMQAYRPEQVLPPLQAHEQQLPSNQTSSDNPRSLPAISQEVSQINNLRALYAGMTPKQSHPSSNSISLPAGLQASMSEQTLQLPQTNSEYQRSLPAISQEVSQINNLRALHADMTPNQSHQSSNSISLPAGLQASMSEQTLQLPQANSEYQRSLPVQQTQPPQPVDITQWMGPRYGQPVNTEQTNFRPQVPIAQPQIQQTQPQPEPPPTQPLSINDLRTTYNNFLDMFHPKQNIEMSSIPQPRTSSSADVVPTALDCSLSLLRQPGNNWSNYLNQQGRDNSLDAVNLSTQQAVREIRIPEQQSYPTVTADSTTGGNSPFATADKQNEVSLQNEISASKPKPVARKTPVARTTRKAPPKYSSKDLLDQLNINQTYPQQQLPHKPLEPPPPPPQLTLPSRHNLPPSLYNYNNYNFRNPTPNLPNSGIISSLPNYRLPSHNNQSNLSYYNPTNPNLPQLNLGTTPPSMLNYNLHQGYYRNPYTIPFK